MPQQIAIYIRVSTQEQAQEGYSVEQQTERLTAYCKAKNWPIADVYTDPGFSGANTQRPALQKLFADIEAGKVDCVLVYKLDGLSRSQKDTLYMIEDVFLAHGVAFVSLQENFDTSTPFGRAMIGILSVFAQLEREQIKERMAMGKVGRAKAGLFHGGGYYPFGYDYIDGHLVVNQTQAIIVRDVYDMFLSRMPINQIEGIIHEKYGLHIHHTLVRSILTTPIYIGLITWAGVTYPGQHEPLVDDDTFKRTQDLLHDRARIAASKPAPFRATHLLSGLLVCGTCGALYFTRKNHTSCNGEKIWIGYYHCYSRAGTKDRVVDPNCNNPTYRVDELDARITEEIIRMVNDKAYFQSMLGMTKKKDVGRIEADRITLMRKIDSLDLQISRVIDLYQLGNIGIEDIGKRTKQLQEEKTALQKTLDGLVMPEDERLEEDEALSTLHQCIAVLESDNMEAKRAILQRLIRKIVVKPVKGELDIHWNF